MKLLWIALIVALSLAPEPELAEAGGRRGHGGGHGFRGGSGGRHHHHGHHRRHHGHHRHGFRHRAFFPAFVPPSVVLSSPVVVAPTTVYAPQPVYAPAPVYAPPTAYAAPPVPPPPIPRVVEYPGGRYELRGDGVTSPYVWVWIPNPPAAPPSPPPAVPPADGLEPSLSPREPGQRTVTYRWTDEAGVTTWTDSLEKVPTRFRAQAAQSAVTR
jgi:hypothetical protein